MLLNSGKFSAGWELYRLSWARGWDIKSTWLLCTVSVCFKNVWPMRGFNCLPTWAQFIKTLHQDIEFVIWSNSPTFLSVHWYIIVFIVHNLVITANYHRGYFLELFPVHLKEKLFPAIHIADCPLVNSRDKSSVKAGLVVVSLVTSSLFPNVSCLRVLFARLLDYCSHSFVCQTAWENAGS